MRSTDTAQPRTELPRDPTEELRGWSLEGGHLARKELSGWTLGEEWLSSSESARRAIEAKLKAELNRPAVRGSDKVTRHTFTSYICEAASCRKKFYRRNDGHKFRFCCRKCSNARGLRWQKR